MEKITNTIRRCVCFGLLVALGTAVSTKAGNTVLQEDIAVEIQHILMQENKKTVTLKDRMRAVGAYISKHQLLAKGVVCAAVYGVCKLFLSKRGADGSILENNHRVNESAAGQKAVAQGVHPSQQQNTVNKDVVTDNKRVIKTGPRLSLSAQTQQQENSNLLQGADLGNIDAVKKALANGADIHARDQWGRTAWMLVAGLGDKPELEKLLLEHGAKKEKLPDASTFSIDQIAHAEKRLIGDGGWYRLTGRSEEDFAVVCAMLRDGARINDMQDNHGETLLISAISQRSTDVVRLLLERGVRVGTVIDRGGGMTTPLIVAVRNGYNKPENIKPIVEMLFQAGSFIAEEDEKDRTALWHAAYYAPVEVVESLLAQQKDYNAGIIGVLTDNHFPKVVAELVVEYAQNYSMALHEAKDVQVVQLLLDHKAAIDMIDEKGRTPLMKAVIWTRPQVVELLLTRKANHEVRDYKGETLLMHASHSFMQSKGIEDIAKVQDLLLNLKAQVALDAQRNDGETALTLAANRYDHSLVRKLIAWGADTAQVKSMPGARKYCYEDDSGASAFTKMLSSENELAIEWDEMQRVVEEAEDERAKKAESGQPVFDQDDA